MLFVCGLCAVQKLYFARERVHTFVLAPARPLEGFERQAAALCRLE